MTIVDPIYKTDAKPARICLPKRIMSLAEGGMLGVQSWTDVALIDSSSDFMTP